MNPQAKHTRSGVHCWTTTAVAVLTVMAALVGVVPSPAAAQTTKAAKDQKPAKDLPALASAAPPVAPLEVPTGDFSNPPPPPEELATRRPDVKPRSVDLAKTTVDDAQTTATKKVHVAADGTRTAEVSPSPVRFKDPTGKWEDIDLAIVAGPDGTLGAKSVARNTRISPQADGTVAVLDTDAGPIGLRHPQASAAPATTKERRAAFKGVLGGRDLAIDMTSNGLEETVSLADRAAARSYLDDFTLPAGVTAKARDGGGVSFLDAKGDEVANFASGLAYDSAGPGGGPGAIGSVSVKLLGVAPAASTTAPKAIGTLAPGAKVLADRSAGAASVASVEVSVDAQWADDAARVYPIHIDPLFTYQFNATEAGDFDALVVSGVDQNNDFQTSPYLAVGTDNGGSHVARSELGFNMYGIAGPGAWVTEAHLSIWSWSSASVCDPRGVVLSGLGGPVTAPVTWNRQAPVDAVGAVSNTNFARYRGYGGACTEGYQGLDATNLIQRVLMYNSPNYGVQLRAWNEADNSSFKWFYSAEAGGAAYAPTMWVTFGHLANSSVPGTPADGAVVTTATPVFSTLPGTDPDGGPVKMWFRATSSPDVESGDKVIDSGWLTATPPGTPCAAGQICYAAPPGSLFDGVTYYWHVWTWDGETGWVNPNWTSSFRVDLRLGDKGPFPRDQMGPAQVNLANGNLAVGMSSPSFPTVGGPVGLSYTYNSQATPATVGLSGAYYLDNGAHNIDATVPTLIRRDPNVSFLWYNSAPAPVIPTTAFMARWNGWISVPATGTYYFGASMDGGARVKVGATTVLDAWYDHATTAVAADYGAPMAMTAGTKVPIQIDYFQTTGTSYMMAAARGPFGPGGADAATYIPPSWLSSFGGAAGGQALSQGWSLSPANVAYVSARMEQYSVVFTDAAGAAHTYLSTGTGFTPPPDEDGVVGLDSFGRLALHATDGTTYTFDAAGRLSSVVAALDDSTPASPVYEYSTDPSRPTRLASILDPVGNRRVYLRYAGRDTCPTGAPAGFDAAAPADSLCKVDWWDGTSSVYWYKAAQLARIVDPGNPTVSPTPPDAPAVSDFGYANGVVVSLRSPLAADAVAAGTATDAVASTTVAYDTAARVANVTLASTIARPGHSYLYTSPTRTQVNVAGLTQPNGYGRQVDMDSSGRVLTDTDATAKSTTFVWDAGDRMTSTTDAAGRKSTTLYDTDATRAQPTGRPTHSYGPNAASCFQATGEPTAACAATTPHSAAAYDTDADTSAPWTGLAASWWDNRDLAGAQRAHGLTVPTAGAMVSADPPVSNLTAGNWSARWDGEATLAATGTWGFAMTLTGRARLYVDDKLVVDAWTPHAGPTVVNGVAFANTVAGRHRIRVDYAAQAGAAAQADLRWTPPGGAQITVPASALAPRFSRSTRTQNDDTTGARVSTAAYDSPANGLLKRATVDPGGLGLVTAYTYEAPAGPDTYMRPTSKALASGAATAYAYYAKTEVVTNPCPGGTATSQAGALKTATGADPDGTGPQVARVEEYIYNARGQVVASRIGAGAWTCATYDARGRVTSRSFPANGTEAARTVTYDYKVGGDPLVSASSDSAGTVSAKTDLAGRIVSATDAWAKMTTSTYDQPGRLISSTGPRGALATDYDAAGRPTAQRLDGATLATPAYDGAGELASVAYANGTRLDAVGRDSAGRLTALTWKAAGGVLGLASDTVTRSQAGRVTDESIDGADANPAGANFTYDPAGRLITAAVPGHSLAYGFGTSSGCTLAPNAGVNANRASVTDNAVTTTYCYDAADRLVSSSDPAVGTPAYDARGNTTTLGAQSLSFDGADRHTKTSVASGPTVTYLRDATNRIIARTEGTTTTRYGFAGPGDGPAFTMDTANAVQERMVGLVGGAMLTKRAAGDVWSYPNVHGDVIASANAAGAKQGATLSYDPFGQATAVPDNSAGNMDYGWLGGAQRPSEHAAGIATIEMGARPYVPGLGRFLSVDPVAGGCANDYVYVHGDPVNTSDVDGTQATPSCASHEQRQNWGTIFVQVSPKGTLAWGAYPNDAQNNRIGLWIFQIKVDGDAKFRKFGLPWAKTQTYAPHGSIKAKNAPSGSKVEISVGYAGRGGIAYGKLTCLMP